MKEFLFQEACYIEDTAERGINSEQLRRLVGFISTMADKWCESYGQDAGRPLEFKIFKYIMRIIGSSSQQQLAMEKDAA